MHKNKIISFILIFVMTFSTLFSFSISNATETIIFDGEEVTKEEIKNNLDKLRTDNIFELTMSGIFLDVGDFILDYIVFLFEDEITIDRLIFNDVISLNANFFEANKNEFAPSTTQILCGVVNNWYSFFKAITLMVYLIFLVFVGVKILLRNS